MAKLTPGVINLESRLPFEVEDGISTSVVTPGDLLSIDAGAENQVERQTPAAGVALKYIAMPLTDIGKGIDDDYASGDTIKFLRAVSGDKIFGLVPASAAAIVRGNFLESAGAGKLRLLAAGVALAVALEDVDNSGGGTPARLRYVFL